MLRYVELSSHLHNWEEHREVQSLWKGVNWPWIFYYPEVQSGEEIWPSLWRHFLVSAFCWEELQPVSHHIVLLQRFPHSWCHPRTSQCCWWHRFNCGNFHTLASSKEVHRAWKAQVLQMPRTPNGVKGLVTGFGRKDKEKIKEDLNLPPTPAFMSLNIHYYDNYKLSDQCLGLC